MLRRGRAETIDRDRGRTAALVDDVVRTGDSGSRVWCPPRQLAFGRRDVNCDGYERARTAASDRSFVPTTREVGGRAVAFTGATVAFVHASPVEAVRHGIQDRYDETTTVLRNALSNLGVDATPGEPDAAFCPGSHSLQAGGKIAGLAQRVRTDVAVVAGIVVTDRQPFVGVLESVYEHLDVAFDPAAVGSVSTAGGPRDPTVVADAIAGALVDH